MESAPCSLSPRKIHRRNMFRCRRFSQKHYDQLRFFFFFRSYAIHLHVYTRRPFRLYKILLRDVLYITYVYNNFYFNWILSCIHDLSYVSYRLIHAFPMSNHKWLSVTCTRTNSIRRVYYIFHTIIDLVRRVRIKIYIYIFSFRRPTPSPFRII